MGGMSTIPSLSEILHTGPLERSSFQKFLHLQHQKMGHRWKTIELWNIGISGWWLSPTPLKNDGLKVSWDDDIPNWMET